jgi:hypothetical protein
MELHVRGRSRCRRCVLRSGPLVCEALTIIVGRTYIRTVRIKKSRALPQRPRRRRIELTTAGDWHLLDVEPAEAEQASE